MTEYNNPNITSDKNSVSGHYKEKIVPLTQIDFEALPPETRELLTLNNISEKLIELIQNAGRNKSVLILQGFSTLINALGVEFVNSKWNQLLDMGIVAGETVYDLFKSGFPELEKAIGKEFIDKHWDELTKIGTSTGPLSWAIYQHVIPSWKEKFGDEYLETNLTNLASPGLVTQENIGMIEEEGIPIPIEEDDKKLIEEEINSKTDTKQINQTTLVSDNKENIEETTSPPTEECKNGENKKKQENIDNINHNAQSEKKQIDKFEKDFEANQDIASESNKKISNYKLQRDMVIFLKDAMMKDLNYIKRVIENSKNIEPECPLINDNSQKTTTDNSNNETKVCNLVKNNKELMDIVLNLQEKMTHFDRIEEKLIKMSTRKNIAEDELGTFVNKLKLLIDEYETFKMSETDDYESQIEIKDSIPKQEPPIKSNEPEPQFVETIEDYTDSNAENNVGYDIEKTIENETNENEINDNNKTGKKLDPIATLLKDLAQAQFANKKLRTELTKSKKSFTPLDNNI